MNFAILAFAILSLAGSWSVWRRSPLYSHKITLKLVAVFLAIVGVVLGATSAIFHGAGQSPAMQAVLIGLLILGVGIGATAGLIHIADSHLAQLPPDTQIVTTERHKVQRWIWRIVAYIAISGAIMLAIPEDWTWLPGVPALLLLLGAGPSLTALYMRARRLDLGLSQTLASPWVRWQYSPAEWQAWAQNQLEWERSKPVKPDWKRDWRKILLTLLLFSWLFAGSAWLTVSGTTGEKLTAAGVSEGLLVGFVALVSLANRGVPERHYRKLLAAPREAVFGDEGLYCNGRFSPWQLSGCYLIEARAPADTPARLEMVFRGTSSAGNALETRRVPIPGGRESDVAAIRQGLRKCCPAVPFR
jgi:hypothetical protein